MIHITYRRRIENSYLKHLSRGIRVTVCGMQKGRVGQSSVANMERRAKDHYCTASTVTDWEPLFCSIYRENHYWHMWEKSTGLTVPWQKDACITSVYATWQWVWFWIPFCFSWGLLSIILDGRQAFLTVTVWLNDTHLKNVMQH